MAYTGVELRETTVNLSLKARLQMMMQEVDKFMPPIQGFEVAVRVSIVPRNGLESFPLLEQGRDVTVGLIANGHDEGYVPKKFCLWPLHLNFFDFPCEFSCCVWCAMLPFI